MMPRAAAPGPAVIQATARGTRGPQDGHRRAAGATLTGRDTGTMAAMAARVAAGQDKMVQSLLSSWWAVLLMPCPPISASRTQGQGRERLGADPAGSPDWALTQP